MDKILAFSILSSSPADIAVGGGYYSTRLSWRTVSGGNQKQQQAEKKAPKQDKAEQQQGSLPIPERKQQDARAPRFAPEFDGINCFESIVSF